MRNPEEWPTFFPSDCPPEDALDMTGDVFRFVVSDPPKQDPDMLSYFETGELPSAKPRDRAGLSAGVDLEHFKEVRANSKRFRRHLIAKATLQASMGKMSKPSPSYHTNLWFRKPVLVVAASLFKVIP